MNEEQEDRSGATSDESSGAPKRLVLSADERRVLGTLIEKGLTNPTSYPLSTSALVSGCNQKSNRDPITRYGEEEVEAICQGLMEKGLVTRFRPGEGGRVQRYRQEMGRNHELRGVELAVVGELLLRGPQAVGELRQRASRMREIATLEDLRVILDKLAHHRPTLVTRLSPDGAVRGVRYTHAAYNDHELAAVLTAEASGASSVAAMPRAASPASAAAPGEMDALKARVDALEDRLARLEAALGGEPVGEDGE